MPHHIPLGPNTPAIDTKVFPLQLHHWPLVVAGMVIVTCILQPLIAVSLAPWAFALSFIFLGMPHGAYDVMLITKHRKRLARNASTLAGLYLLGIVLVGLLWWMSPSWTLVGFFLLTAIHWGTMDTQALEHPTWLHLIDGHARGLMVISSIFAFHSQDALDALKPLTLPTAIPWTYATPFMLIFFLSFGVQCAMIMQSRHCWKHDTLELIIISVMLAIAPVLLGIATYYLCIHSRRHFQRLKIFDVHAFGTAHKFCLGIAIPMIILLVTIKPMHEVVGMIHGSFPVHLSALALLTLPHAFLSHRVHRLARLSCRTDQS